MYLLEIKPSLDKKLAKIYKKNRKQFESIMKKVEEIIQNPQHYKNLRVPMQHLKRVHIDASFVLIFSVDENTKTVTLIDFEHHDNVY